MKNIWKSLVIIIAVIGLIACGNEGKASEKDGKVIHIGYQKGNTLHILRESGILEKALAETDYTVNWEMFTHGGTLLEGIYAGVIDFGHAADGSGIFAQASGKPFVYVGADAPNPEGVGLMVKEASGITDLADLKGKKIGVIEGGNHHYLAILAIEDAGLTVEDVEWVYPEDAAQGRTLFETDQIDALASYDPFFAAVEKEMDVITLTEGKTYDDYPNRTFYFATETFASEEPELVEIILSAIDESDTWANENKPEVVALLSESLGIKEEIIAHQLDRRTFGATEITEEIIETQQKQADKYVDIELIKEKINIEERVK